jgi:broad specificity phosphatase PhoE
LTLEPLAPVPFWYLRHGETDWNARGVSQGSIDIPLNPTGVAQARAAAEQLRDRGIKTIVASPLSRARVTAEIVAEVLGLPVLIDPDLKEVNWGVQEGQPMAEWFADWVGGGLAPKGGETFAELHQRAIVGLNRSLVHPSAVLIVAHGALFRAIRAGMGIEPNRRTQNGVPMWCTPSADGWTIDNSSKSEA